MTGPQHNALLDSFLFLCRHHGYTFNRDGLISGLPIAEGTLTPVDFPKVAERAGFNCKFTQQAIQSLNRALLPAILLGEEKACVLLSLDRDAQIATVVYPDLPDTPTTVGVDELRDFADRAIYCRPQQKIAKPKPAINYRPEGNWLKRIVLANYKLYRDVIAGSVFINLLALALPFFVMNVYDRVLPNSAIETLWVLALGIFVVFVLEIALKLVRSWFIDLAAVRTDVKLSSSLMEKLMGLDLKYRPATTGSTASILQSFDGVRQFISSITIVSLAEAPFYFLFLLVIGLVHWTLVLPIFAATAILLFYTLISQSSLKTLSDNAIQGNAERNSSLVEALSGLESVKAFNRQSNFQRKWEDSALFVSRNSAKMKMVSNSTLYVAELVQKTTSIAVIIVGVYLAINGHISQGGIVAAYLLTGRAMVPVSQAAALLAQYHIANTAMTVLDKLYETPQEASDSQAVDIPYLNGDIEFRNVSFRYADDGAQTLNNVSFKIKAGEKVAILGKNGSGKSSIQKLMMGLYAPSDGDVLVDNHNLKHADKHQLRRFIGYVPQETILFSGTLRENMELSRSANSHDEFQQVLEETGLLPLVHQHPLGLSQQVGEGGRLLSGGQRQSVAVARALLGNPAMLVLDEPTASLDHATEEKIRTLIAEKTVAKTVVLITHRMPLLTLVDRIIVVDQGRVVADGAKDTVIEALRLGKISGAR